MLIGFLFIQHGCLGCTRLRNGLLGSQAAGLRGPDGGNLVVTAHHPHQTWAAVYARLSVRDVRPYPR